ncbi:MAG: IS200/IS605 family transposase [Thermoguttaceae bacterium]|jgi:putative transposase|nr:IS200/IS605 family transposase [Thermoguttaceae bacterium]
MPQSLSRVLLHIVFSTKQRKPWISPAIQDRLHAYLAGTCRGIGSEAFRVGGMADHVHIACSLPRTMTISKLVERIKTTTSAWMKGQDKGPRHFAWQGGYGAFSLGLSQLSSLIDYIDRQEEHHRKRSFHEEFLDILRRYNVPYDERYVCD